MLPKLPNVIRSVRNIPFGKFVCPELPDSLDAAGKTEYVLAHYWDGFDFEDRTWIADTVSMEQAFADWAFILLNIPQEIAVKHAGRPIAKAAVDSPMFVRFWRLQAIISTILVRLTVAKKFIFLYWKRLSPLRG